MRQGQELDSQSNGRLPRPSGSTGFPLNLMSGHLEFYSWKLLLLERNHTKV